MRFFLAATLGYLIGSISFAVIVGRVVRGIDVRMHGSGTAGAANVGSLLGVKYGVLVAFCDIAKGMVAALTGRTIGGAACQMASGAAAVIGHILPIWFGFRGGKAIATFFGSCLLTVPVVIPVAGALWVAVYLFLRHIARASAITALCLPVIGCVLHLPLRTILYLGVMGVAICLRHVQDCRSFKGEHNSSRP